MGRGKPEPKQAAWHGEGADENEAQPGELLCGICGDAINETKEEFLRVFCNKCNHSHCHMECGIEFLIARASEKTNSIAANKYKVKARKRPVEIFDQRMPCPNGIFKLSNDGERQPGSQAFRGKHTLTGMCSGFTSGAELIKPAKEPPAPLPQILAARGPKEKKEKKEAAGAAATQAAAPKRSSSSASSTLHLSTGKARTAPGAAAPGSGASVHLLGSSQKPWTKVGDKKPPPGHSVPGAAPAPDRLRLPPGVSRPAELCMCKHILEDGDCYVYHCAFAHSEEEVRQREKAWLVRQETKRKEAARRQAAAQAAAQARLEEEQTMLAQLASMESLYDAPQPQPRQPAWGASSPPSAVPAPAPASTSSAPPPSTGLRLTQHSLTLLRAFKRSFCLNSLLEMGFPADQAGAAVDAAAGDVERAAQMLMDGQNCSGTPPVDVSRESEELASMALAVGIDTEGLEAQLVLTGGNWEAAAEALQQAVPGGGASGFGGSSAAPEECASWAPSQPDTPSAVGGLSPAPWATDASSSLSAPSPYSQSPRAAAAAAAMAASSLAPGAIPAAPGVLSLADFSDGPGPQTGAPAGWQEGVFSYGGGGASGAVQIGSSALPTPVGLPSSAPLSAAAPGPAAAAPVGYDEGYFAGLAGAAAMYGPQAGAALPAHDQPFSAATPVAASTDVSALYWGAQPAPVSGVAPEEDLDDLLLMLGVS